MPIKAILFDLDNTLIDFMKMKQESCNAAINAMIKAGLKTEKNKALKVLHELYDEYGIEYQYIFEKLLKKLKGKIDYKLMAHGIIAYRKIRATYLTPYSNVIPTLKKLKNKYKLAIVSDAPIMRAWMRLATMQLDEFFDVVITKGDVKKQKTSTTPFRVALRKLKIKPEEALMIGDRISRDIKTPKKLGIKTCYARYGDLNPVAKGKSTANFEINDIKEILEILKTID